MGWTNSHLHQFVYEGLIYMEPDPMDELDSKDYRKVSIAQLLKKGKDKILYEYDFGDGWMHEILLEKILKKEEYQIYPICVSGENACPPEDCGGIPGYRNLVEVISNPKHEEYQEWMEWLGGKFDPEAFDKEEINEMLTSEDFGVITFLD